MRVLVSPASKHGGTAEIGRFIATKLRENGLDVDVTQPEDIHDLTPYAGFVMGSALYFGSWLPQAERFVDDHSRGLNQKPTWLFSSGPLGSNKPDEPIDDDRVEHLLAATGAHEHRLFGGRLERDRLSRPERFVARWVGIDDCDHRDWDEIERWTNAIAATLQDGQPDTERPEKGDPDEPLQSSLAHLKATIERLETDHPELTRAVNDVSYYLSGMGI
ncbi:MAG: flavodoxin domain-containing protein [Acidimicrobiales bacterium]